MLRRELQRVLRGGRLHRGGGGGDGLCDEDIMCGGLELGEGC